MANLQHEHSDNSISGSADLNTEMRKILNGENITLRLLIWEHWNGMLNDGNPKTEEHYMAILLYFRKNKHNGTQTMQQWNPSLYWRVTLFYHPLVEKQTTIENFVCHFNQIIGN